MTPLRASGIFALMFLASPAASGSCDRVAAAIRKKAGSLRLLREAEAGKISEVAKVTGACRKNGADLSRKAGSTAKGDICRSLDEARKLDTEMKNIGQQCTGEVRGLHHAQQKILKLMASARSDIDVAARMVEPGSFLAQRCPREVSAVAEMKEAFRSLEIQIMAADVGTFVKGMEFSRFERMAASLEQTTTRRPANCPVLGGTEIKPASRAPAAVPGAGAAEARPGRKAKSANSGLTGVENALRNEAESEKAVSKTRR